MFTQYFEMDFNILSFEKDFSLVSSPVADGIELVAVKKYKLHVIVTDLKMSYIHGPKACIKIQEEYCETSIIVYSMYGANA